MEETLGVDVPTRNESDVTKVFKEMDKDGRCGRFRVEARVLGVYDTYTLWNSCIHNRLKCRLNAPDPNPVAADQLGLNVSNIRSVTFQCPVLSALLPIFDNTPETNETDKSL